MWDHHRVVGDGRTVRRIVRLRERAELAHEWRLPSGGGPIVPGAPRAERSTLAISAHVETDL
jgi:hypothetical protein